MNNVVLLVFGSIIRGSSLNANYHKDGGDDVVAN